ncbi:hypothetical protein [Psychrobacter sp. FDAARGOS_221]|uniref:hypothetical protein n=1 Tax=Psychrobacter sp. FDAARGOS_221 TaxID=1975705 RepID=UPI000BB58591|nr:hypothetical protein [Psychrobacter sp. FDAARGOS_221]PNK60741.1 hypothetical protein A6J60_007540 [Psychrobacter sp. FDAARGOS_221]
MSAQIRRNITQPDLGNKIVVLLLGASGFIGGQLKTWLSKQPNVTLITPTREQVNFITPDWQQITAQLQGVDVVVNAIGIMSRQRQLLEQVHHTIPVKMAILAKRFHVKHWINLSALCAHPQHSVAFLSTKGQGDAQLMALADTGFRVSIARPSLVFGSGGASTAMFLGLAKLPVLILPDRGRYLIQPVHIDDVVQGLAALVLSTLVLNTNNNCDNTDRMGSELIAADTGLDNLQRSSDSEPDNKQAAEKVKRKSSNNPSNSQLINMTGSEVVSFAHYISALRIQRYQLAVPNIIPIPWWLAQMGLIMLSPISWLLSALTKGRITEAMLTTDSLRLLADGSIADNRDFIKLLGRKPLGYRQFCL